MFTETELYQIIHYIDMNKESFTYYGNKEQFEKREKSIELKIHYLLNAKNEIELELNKTK